MSQSNFGEQHRHSLALPSIGRSTCGNQNYGPPASFQRNLGDLCAKKFQTPFIDKLFDERSGSQEHLTFINTHMAIISIKDSLK